MRVNGINNYNIYNVPALNINGKTHSYNIKLNNSKDIITFGAKRKPPAQNISKNSKEAFQLGKRVYSSLMFDPTKQKALEIITNEDPSLKIYDIEELKNEIPNAKNYSAYLRSYLNPDYTVENLGFYINLAPLDENDKTGKMKFAMETAHEYTHVRQNANGDSAGYLKNIAGKDEEYAEFLAGFGKCVFEYFDGELQAMFVSSVIDEKDIPLIQKYNILCPKEKLVTKQMMFKKYGFKSEAEFKQFMNISLQNEFKKVAGAFMEHKDSLDERTREYIERSGVFSKDNLGKLYADTKKYCKYQAIKEQEAYTTESMTAKSIMNTKRSINSDIYPLYYEMTAAAFN